MTQKMTIGKLVRKAHANPELRPKVLPIIRAALQKRRMASVPKAAISKDTENFIEWALNQKQVPANVVEKFVNGPCKVPTKDPKKKRGGPRFQKGDLVLICANKHKDGSTMGPYKTYDRQSGTVTEIDGKDALVEFRGERTPIRFEGAQKSRGVGIYKYTPAFTVSGSPGIEMIYVAGGRPTPDQKLEVQFYKGKGRGTESRSGQYYTGHVIGARKGGKGFYFTAFPQQRMAVPESTCGGSTFLARSFNPNTGKVFYMGLLGHRPSNWQRELDEMRTAAAP